jgi:hypothetical protein
MKIRLAVGAIAITAALVGCGTKPADTTTSAPTTTRAPSQEAKENALVGVLQARLGGGSRSEVIDIAKQACYVVETSGSVAGAMASIIADDSIDMETGSDMAYVMGVAIPVYCPEYKAEMDRITG